MYVSSTLVVQWMSLCIGGYCVRLTSVSIRWGTKKTGWQCVCLFRLGGHLVDSLFSLHPYNQWWSTSTALCFSFHSSSSPFPSVSCLLLHLSVTPPFCDGLCIRLCCWGSLLAFTFHVNTHQLFISIDFSTSTVNVSCVSVCGVHGHVCETLHAEWGLMQCGCNTAFSRGVHLLTLTQANLIYPNNT